MDLEKPLPSLQDADALQFWQAAKEHRLALQWCSTCKSFLYPPGPACALCGAIDIVYKDIGREVTGSLYSYIITHRAFVPGFATNVPYVVALAEINEACNMKLLANLINCAPEKVRIGMQLRMVWEDRTPEVTLPQWEPL
ncbi:MAG: hypothetical protein A3F74_23000 [Betaproteobacteria bacterium RIFCSPLOWO2_12_FULL_62_58]|nr:MAG: hypothetical protein A3F74_23000 [Betaproteobacteria bacterium RIFCSPLOWO2_12_FULL_62_58]